MIFQLFLVVYTAFNFISLLLMDRPSIDGLTIAVGLAFLLSASGDQRFGILRYGTMLFLGWFHWLSKSDWCHPLYLILTAREMDRMRQLWKGVLFSLLIGSVYITVRLTYIPLTSDELLVTVVDLIGFPLVTIAVSYLIKTKQKNKMPVSHDSLTGLLNYQECHKRLESLVHKQNPFTFFLIDCNDLKSMNDEHGFQEGNQILIKIAEQLRSVFPQAFLIARYGGDEFALAIPCEGEEHAADHVIRWMQAELPGKLNIQVTYGYSVFPVDGQSKDELLSIAERRLFAKKRELWLKREEHMLRSEKLKVVGELAASIAHEIRNPITTIKGFLQISKESRYNIEPYYELMMQEIMRVSELTSELLKFSRPNAAQYHVQSMQDCVQRVIFLTQAEATFLGIEMKWEIATEPLNVLMDKDKMIQVLLNLVKNAFEAMEKHGVVTIRLFRQDRYGVIEIEDTGEGIPVDKMDQIFLPFFTTKENGTGLGLAICHQIIQDQGGVITVQSTVGTGTTFRILLPLVENLI